MRLLVTGSSGTIGSALVKAATERGDDVIRLVRGAPKRENGEAGWNPTSGQVDAQALDGADALVHLAGESIAEGRWTAAKKRRILSSRVEGTRTLVNAMRGLVAPPKVFLCASAIGYYGDRGDEVLDEQSPPGAGFLPEVCKAWETEAERAVECGVRVIRIRIGVVLDRGSGMLARILPVFRKGLGGTLGGGVQFVSWIDLGDLVRAMLYCLNSDGLEGPVNAVAPKPVTNAELTKELAEALGRHALLPAPAFMLRLALGEMTDELLLSSLRVEPRKLLNSGFRFDYADIQTALRKELDGAS
ncbi:MAG TPA: TIGR01777 family oxidoreductase [Candidatus Brocadiia bacterium]|nr:TIGR01777 family oxidoreductase [Candidatus Brocadiia bacterium]